MSEERRAMTRLRVQRFRNKRAYLVFPAFGVTGKKLLITTVVKVQNCGEIKVKTMTIATRCQGFFLSPNTVYLSP